MQNLPRRDFRAGHCGTTAWQNAAPVSLFELNHVSYESPDHEALAQFYEHVLGFKRLPRPAFKFDGAWLQGPGGLSLHIIERDPESAPLVDEIGRLKQQARQEATPRFIRRGNHLAFGAANINQVCKLISSHGCAHTIFTVPGNNQKQVFLFDPDGNGVELIQSTPPATVACIWNSSSAMVLAVGIMTGAAVACLVSKPRPR